MKFTLKLWGAPRTMMSVRGLYATVVKPRMPYMGVIWDAHDGSHYINHWVGLN